MTINIENITRIFKENKVSSLQELFLKKIKEANISGFSVKKSINGNLIMNVDNSKEIAGYLGLDDKQKVEKYISDLKNHPA